jgi:hypothetical protein
MREPPRAIYSRYESFSEDPRLTDQTVHERGWTGRDAR